MPFRNAARLLFTGFACLAFAGATSLWAQTKKIHAVVLTGQHSYPPEFWTLFDGLPDITYDHVDLPGESEIFEDISNWKYDVIVMHNSGQAISAKREANFIALLNRGVGLVVVHHGLCAYEGWPEFRKIEGTKFYGAAEVYNGVRYESNYKLPVSINVIIDDKASPLMQGFKNFTLTDEVYTDMSYEPDNHVLAHTDNPLIPGAPLVWTRRYGNANVFVITLGHRAETLTGAFMHKLVPDAMRWSVSAGATGLRFGGARLSIAPVQAGTFSPQAGTIFYQGPFAPARRWDARGEALMLTAK